MKMEEGRMRFEGGFVTLQESGKRTFEARFVRAGKVRAAGPWDSNLVVEAEAIRGAVEAGLFEGAAMFIDHPGFFESPSMRNLAGVVTSSLFNEETESADGEFKLYESEPGDAMFEFFQQVLDDPDGAPDVGLSIVFWPRFAPRDDPEEPRRIVGIRQLDSVDFVFKPAADGRVLEALSALTVNSEVFIGGGQSPRATLGSLPDGKHPKGEREMEEREVEVVENEGTQPEVNGGDGRDGADKWFDSAHRWFDASRRAAAASMINAASDLPAASRRRLLAREYDSPEDVEAEIEMEREVLAELIEGDVVQMGGDAPRGGAVSGMVTGWEQFEIAFDAMLDGVRPPAGVRPLSGIREAYMLLSGDYELTGRFQPERVMFANVTTATMANMTADRLNKRLVNEFQQYPRFWEPFVIDQDFDSLQDVKWITLGGVGALPTVPEGGGYTELTWDDYQESQAFIKKGGYLGLTLEAIDKDDTGRLRAAPRALAQGAWLTLAQSISNIFTSNSGTGPTLSDSNNLFDAGNHSNLGSSALTFAAWDATRIAMRKQTEVNSGERLGALTAPKFLLVPPDLETTGLQVLASAGEPGTADNDENPFAEGEAREARFRSARRRVIVIDLWTDTDNWAAVADPMMYPSIGVG